MSTLRRQKCSWTNDSKRTAVPGRRRDRHSRVRIRVRRDGIGSRIVQSLTRFVEAVPFKNTWIGVFAVEGTVEFYARYGYRAQAPTGPAMYRWLNRSDA